MLTGLRSPSFVRALIIGDEPAIAANLYDFLVAGRHDMDAAAHGVTGRHHE
jgi:hypothetical protein